MNNGIPSNVLYISSIVILGSNILLGNDDMAYNYNGLGVYLSTNNGANWINKSQGFNDSMPVYSLLVTNNYIFAGLFMNNVWRRPLSDNIGIQNISTETPSSYSLSTELSEPVQSVD